MALLTASYPQIFCRYLPFTITCEPPQDRRSGKEPWNPLHRDASSFLIPFHLRPKGRYAGETGEDEERYERHSVTPGLSLSPPLTRFTRYPQGEDSTVQGETDPVG